MGHFVASSWSKPKTKMQNGCSTDSISHEGRSSNNDGGIVQKQSHPPSQQRPRRTRVRHTSTPTILSWGNACKILASGSVKQAPRSQTARAEGPGNLGPDFGSSTLAVRLKSAQTGAHKSQVLSHESLVGGPYPMLRSCDPGPEFVLLGRISAGF